MLCPGLICCSQAHLAGLALFALLCSALARLQRNTSDDAVFLSGVELLQPSTALAGLALLCAAVQRPGAHVVCPGGRPSSRSWRSTPLPHEEEAQLQASFLACSCR